MSVREGLGVGQTFHAAFQVVNFASAHKILGLQFIKSHKNIETVQSIFFIWVFENSVLKYCFGFLLNEAKIIKTFFSL